MRAYATVQKLLCHESCRELILSLVRASCRLSFAARPPASSTKSVAVRSRNPSKPALAHHEVAAAVLHKHHLIIRVGTGLIQFVYQSHSRLTTEFTRHRKSFFAIFRASSLGIVLSLQYRALNPAACLLLGKTSQVKSDNVSDVPPVCYHLPAQGLVRLPYFLPTHSATVLHHSTFAALVPLEDCWWNLSALCALALLVIPVHSLKHNVHQLSVDPRGCARRDNCLLPTETS